MIKHEFGFALTTTAGAGINCQYFHVVRLSRAYQLFIHLSLQSRKLPDPSFNPDELFQLPFELRS
jgi:hypothetical protein